MKTRKQYALLDSTDWAILRILQENAKARYTEIGKELNLAHSTVYDRIKKLEKHGIITKYTIAVDFKKTGMKILPALVTIFSDPKESEKIAEQLAKYQQVSEVLISLSEELVIIARISARDQETLHFFIAHNIAPLKGVLRIRTSVISKQFKQEINTPSVDAMTKLATKET
jgi:Lrp/AsnC family transcriptional regulator for asnA, asnC and gidA